MVSSPGFDGGTDATRRKEMMPEAPLEDLVGTLDCHWILLDCSSSRVEISWRLSFAASFSPGWMLVTGLPEQAVWGLLHGI
jgi:hypothetical protein